MKKLFLLCVSALFAAGSYAQTSEEVVVMEVQDVQAVSKYPSVRGFVSNGFWDNWELSFGGGLSMMSTSNLVFKDMPGSFGDRLGFERRRHEVVPPCIRCPSAIGRRSFP